jgi:plasmid stabilization system protein ParE
MKELTLLSDARADLRAIERFSIEEFGPAVANEDMNRVERALDRLID